jgi:hypothetical protein
VRLCVYLCASAPPHTRPRPSGHVLAMRHPRRRHVQKVSANPYFYHTTFPPTIYTTPNRPLSSLVGACKKCRQTPISIIPLSPHYFRTTESRLCSRAGACCLLHGHPAPPLALGLRVRDAPARCWLDTTPPEGRSERHATGHTSVFYGAREI